MEFYDKLLSYKGINKLSWKAIGDVISKEETAMRIAVKRKSLSDLEIREIEKFFFLETKELKKTPTYEKQGVVISLKEAAEFVANNFNKAKEISPLLDMTVRNDNNEHLFNKLTENGIKIIRQ